MYTSRIRILPPAPLQLALRAASALSCSNIILLFGLSLGKYLPWATEAGWIWMGVISACQISRCSLPANVAVIGKSGKAARPSRRIFRGWRSRWPPRDAELRSPPHQHAYWSGAAEMELSAGVCKIFTWKIASMHLWKLHIWRWNKQEKSPVRQ